MAEIKWIKLDTAMFDNRKIKQIRTLPEGDSLVVIWLQLMCLAGTVNDLGKVYFTDEIPYTDQMMATAFDEPLTTVQLALTTFQKFGMIEVIDDIIYIRNWEKYQAVEGMEKVREQTRQRVANYRQKQKQLTCNVTVTPRNATDKEEEKEVDKELEKEDLLHVIDAPPHDYTRTFCFFEDEFQRPLSQMECERILGYIKEYGEEETLDALRDASIEKKVKWPYIEAILRNRKKEAQA